MITILYNKTYSYVPSNHPILFKHLSRQKDFLRVINVAGYKLKNLVSIIGSSDLIVLDQSILNAIYMSTNKIGSNLIYMNIPLLRESSFYKSLLVYLFESDKTLIYWASITDPHGILTVDLAKIKSGDFSVDGLLNRINGVIWNCNSDKIPNVKDVNPEYQEKWFQKMENPKESFATIKKHCKYEIEIPHCISEAEFFKREKKWDIDIPGISYTTRMIAEKAIAKEKFLRPNKKSKIYFSGKLNSLILKSKLFQSTAVFLNNYRLMRYFISRSRITFVCGSGLRYFVRKFIEVPAFHSVMLAYPPENIEDYGFIDGKNFIETTPGGIKEKIEMLLDLPKLRDSLLKNAESLVRDLHTSQQRCDQLINSLQLIRDDKIDKACFEDGKFSFFYKKESVSVP